LALPLHPTAQARKRWSASVGVSIGGSSRRIQAVMVLFMFRDCLFVNICHRIAVASHAANTASFLQSAHRTLAALTALTPHSHRAQ
jgi:hypothetical protein